MHGPFREITIQYIDKSVIFVLGMSVSYIVLRSGNSTYPVSVTKYNPLTCPIIAHITFSVFDSIFLSEHIIIDEMLLN